MLDDSVLWIIILNKTLYPKNTWWYVIHSLTYVYISRDLIQIISSHTVTTGQRCPLESSGDFRTQNLLNLLFFFHLLTITFSTVFVCLNLVDISWSATFVLVLINSLIIQSHCELYNFSVISQCDKDFRPGVTSSTEAFTRRL